jgi:hypothetical protein
MLSVAFAQGLQVPSKIADCIAQLTDDSVLCKFDHWKKMCWKFIFDIHNCQDTLTMEQLILTVFCHACKHTDRPS